MPDQNTPASGFQFSLANLKPAEPLEKITLTFPDGASREYARDITGLEIDGARRRRCRPQRPDFA
jgi:threonyl-tRNA synthetase